MNQDPSESLSAREQEIWRETIGLIPEWDPLFTFPLERYCYYRWQVEQLDAKLSDKTLDPETTRICQEMRETNMRTASDLAIKLSLAPASRSELN